MATGSLLTLDGPLSLVVIEGNRIEKDRSGKRRWYNGSGWPASSYGTDKKELYYANTGRSPMANKRKHKPGAGRDER